MSVNVKMRQRRTDRQMTMQELAWRAKCSESAISYIETGRRRPSPLLAARIAQVLGLETPDLFPEVFQRQEAAS